VTEIVPAALVASVSVYTDSLGRLRLIGPRGWECRASYAEDGSSGLIVYPQGESVPFDTWGARWHLAPGSSSQAISVSQTGLSDAQADGRACPYFAAARIAARKDFGHGCPAPPAAERIRRVGSHIVTFTDPADVTDPLGAPSGGRNPAIGVVRYKAGSASAPTYLMTCTLRTASATICKAEMSAYVSGRTITRR
jgi:hypothetical protein